MSCTKRLSPAAGLLRKSRLVAMPAPVPPPPSYFLRNPNVSPHPTIQAITTPKSSHARGNWGLKRDLPTKTKYPYLRYTKLDTLEHFTNYESAGDDVITLKKWQEMDVPIFKGPAVNHSTLSNSYTQKESVFNTNDPGDLASGENYKWRYGGPYLPDMPAGEFKRYIETKIKPRRREFIEFVAKNQHEFAAQFNSSSHDEVSLEPQGPLQKMKDKVMRNREGKEIDPDEVDILALRGDTFLLEKLVLAFLDIPFHSRPHRTHPSGGLHYTRSTAHVRNDPIEGPRPDPKPVVGRYMNHTGVSGTMVGIGGFIAKAADAIRLDDALRLYNNRQYTRKYSPGVAKLDALGRVLLDLDTVNEDGTRGNYGVRSGQDGETPSDLLRRMVPPSIRGWGSLYNAGSEAQASPGPRVGGVVGRNRDKESHTDAILDLLSGS